MKKTILATDLPDRQYEDLIKLTREFYEQLLHKIQSVGGSLSINAYVFALVALVSKAHHEDEQQKQEMLNDIIQLMGTHAEALFKGWTIE